MSDERRCLQCGGDLKGRRADAVYCRQRCRKRHARRSPSSNYLDPPLSGTTWEAEDRADERWHEEYRRHEEATAPLSPEDQELLARQRRNPGVLLPELRAKQLARAAELRRVEQSERAARSRPIKPESALDPESLGSVARRGRFDRQMNKPADPHLRILRPGPGRSGPPSWNDEPECIDKRDIGWG